MTDFMDTDAPEAPMPHPFRYCYFASGHLQVQEPSGIAIYPYDAVVRLERPVTSDSDADELRARLRQQLDAEVGKSGMYLAADPIIRTLSHLHTIQTNGDDPDERPIRVL